jgi:hypothetical protein
VVSHALVFSAATVQLKLAALIRRLESSTVRLAAASTFQSKGWILSPAHWVKFSKLQLRNVVMLTTFLEKSFKAVVSSPSCQLSLQLWYFNRVRVGQGCSSQSCLSFFGCNSAAQACSLRLYTSAVTRYLLGGKKTDAHTPQPALLIFKQRILTWDKPGLLLRCSRLQLRMFELLHDIVAGCRKDWVG